MEVERKGKRMAFLHWPVELSRVTIRDLSRD